MRKSHGFTLIETLVGLTIVAVLAVGAYTVWQRPVDEKPTTTPTTVPSIAVTKAPTSTPAPTQVAGMTATPTPDPTAEWETGTVSFEKGDENFSLWNIEYSFTIEYPPDYFFSDAATPSTLIRSYIPATLPPETKTHPVPPSNKVTVQINLDGKLEQDEDLPEYMERTGAPGESVDVDNLTKFTDIEESRAYFNKFGNWWVEHDGIVFRVWTWTTENQDIVKKILSTIKFKK